MWVGLVLSCEGGAATHIKVEAAKQGWHRYGRCYWSCLRYPPGPWRVSRCSGCAPASHTCSCLRLSGYACMHSPHYSLQADPAHKLGTSWAHDLRVIIIYLLLRKICIGIIQRTMAEYIHTREIMWQRNRKSWASYMGGTCLICLAGLEFDQQSLMPWWGC